MNELMTRAAEQGKPARQFSFVEITTDLTFPVPGSRDQVMPCQFRASPLAEFTDVHPVLDAQHR